MSFDQHWILAGLGAVAGVLLVIVGWWGDRPRGRRRCPKCWYDLGGVEGLTCSECGCAAKSERKLHRTRRRRWALALGGLLVPAAVAFGMYPDVKEHGWTYYAPNTILVIAFGGVTGENDPVAVTLLGRIGHEPVLSEWPWPRPRPPTELELYGWQKDMLGGSCAKVLDSTPSQQVPAVRALCFGLLEDLGPHGKRAVAACRAHLNAGDHPTVTRAAEALGAIGPAAADAIDDLMEAVRTAPHSHHASRRIRALSDLGTLAAPAVTLLGEKARAQEPQVSGEAVRALGLIGAASAPVLPNVLGVLRAAAPVAQREAAAALGLIAPDDPRAVGALVEALHGGDLDVARAAGESLRRGHDGFERGLESLAAALDDPDAGRRTRAVQGVGATAPASRSLLPAIEPLLEDEDDLVRFAAVWTIRRFGPEGEPLIPALEGRLGDPHLAVRRQAEEALRELRPD